MSNRNTPRRVSDPVEYLKVDHRTFLGQSWDWIKAHPRKTVAIVTLLGLTYVSGEALGNLNGTDPVPGGAVAGASVNRSPAAPEHHPWTGATTAKQGDTLWAITGEQILGASPEELQAMSETDRKDFENKRHAIVQALVVKYGAVIHPGEQIEYTADDLAQLQQVTVSAQTPPNPTGGE